MKWLEFCNTYLLGVAVPLMLLVTGMYFAVRLRGFPLAHPRRFLRAVFRPHRRDGISPMRALSMALAGTLGVGNLIGVSAAIAIGGAGAIFWMWVSATLAMLLKYAETVLALRHRRMHGGVMRGGAMYYIEDAFCGQRAGIGRLLALIFAVLCLTDALSMGCVVQVNAMASAFEGSFAFPAWLMGMLIAVLVLVVGAGGAKAVSGATERLVPLMTIGFVIVSLAAIALRADEVPTLFVRICREAFALESTAGGVTGFLFSRALRMGTMRGLLSNEAGCGTSPMAHATATGADPAEQGCLGILEVFIDTHVLCTMTALVVLLAGDAVTGLENAPMQMTLRAYESLLGRGAGMFLCVAVLCFGLATVFCWSHYAREACVYLVGQRSAYARAASRLCLWVYCLFCVVGACVAPTQIWMVADFSIGCMTLINIGVLCRMHREVEESSHSLVDRKR